MLLFYRSFAIRTPPGDPDLVDLYPALYHHPVPDLDMADPGLDFPALDDPDVHGRCRWGHRWH